MIYEILIISKKIVRSDNEEKFHDEKHYYFSSGLKFFHKLLLKLELLAYKGISLFV